MSLRKTGVVLLALLLAAIAMIPLVSANEQTELDNSSDFSATTEYHKITDDYLKDAKPAEWLPESEMLTIVLSQKTIGKLDQSKKPDIINIPIEYLDSKSKFFSYNGTSGFRIENDLAKDEKIVLIRMPRQLYEQLAKDSHDGILSLPENYFFRYYENISDLYSHIENDGNSLKIYSSDKYPSDDGIAVPNIVKTSLTSYSQTSSTLLENEPLPHMYGAWEKAVRAYTNQNYDYCIGQIKPYSWTVLGPAGDQFTIFQEREYKFNSNEAVEIVVKRFDMNNLGSMQLFPAVWRNGGTYQVNQSEFTQFPGLISIDKNDLPHSYGYHVGFASGYYTINFEDMDTLRWIGQYRITSAPGTSSFTDLAGSSEYERRSTPTTNTFEATTIARDEWARIVGDSGFQYASNTWTPVNPVTDSYVSVEPADSSNGRYTTTSHAQYP